MAIVRDEEIAREWTPGPPLSRQRERQEGCDFFSTPPGGGAPHPVEVKGWGESLFRPDGRFRYPQDINSEQRARAESDPNWRLEIVANLTAARLKTGVVERLTLTAAEVTSRAVPWKYRVPLEGLGPTDG